MNNVLKFLTKRYLRKTGLIINAYMTAYLFVGMAQIY